VTLPTLEGKSTMLSSHSKTCSSKQSTQDRTRAPLSVALGERAIPAR
jgi:hypothetical protein